MIELFVYLPSSIFAIGIFEISGMCGLWPNWMRHVSSCLNKSPSLTTKKLTCKKTLRKILQTLSNRSRNQHRTRLRSSNKTLPLFQKNDHHTIGQNKSNTSKHTVINLNKLPKLKHFSHFLIAHCLSVCWLRSSQPKKNKIFFFSIFSFFF